MKRSRINAVIKDMEALIAEHRFEIPPFAKLTADEWQDIGHEYDEVRDNCLGWDITDYGLGNFDKVGFSLLTIRNGNQKLPDKYPKPYAEKLLMLYEGQTAPMHYHWNKMEDIITAAETIYISLCTMERKTNLCWIQTLLYIQTEKQKWFLRDEDLLKTRPEYYDYSIYVS